MLSSFEVYQKSTFLAFSKPFRSAVFCGTLFFAANSFADAQTSNPAQDPLQALIERLQKYTHPNPEDAPTKPSVNDPGFQEEKNEMEIEGLLIDETKTIRGHNFVDSFINSFNPILGEKSMITISELVDPIRGSYILINVDDRQVFQSILTPKQDAIEETANAAAAQVSQFIVTLFTAPVDADILDP